MFDFLKKPEGTGEYAGLRTQVAEQQAKLEQYEAVFAEMGKVIQSASEGDLSARVVNWDEFDDFSDDIVAFNRVFDLMDAYVREAGATLQAAAVGDYHRKFLVHGMAGDFGHGARVINEVTAEMQTRDHAAITQRQKIADDFEQQILDIVTSLGGAIEQTSYSAVALMERASDTRTLSTSVASAAEQMAGNVETVAAAAEEMSGSVQEIATQVNLSSIKTGAAFSGAEDASNRINALSEASETIGEVVNLISDIANQTNLLALNATIEAARAGEAGRGFAVVASEVKSLAQQTANATGDISAQVQSILERTGMSVEAVEGISTAITELGEVSNSIAAATEEQTATTVEISTSMQQAHLGTQEVSGSIAQVNETAEQTYNSAEELTKSSEDLRQLTDLLRQRASEFLATIRGL